MRTLIHKAFIAFALLVYIANAQTLTFTAPTTPTQPGAVANVSVNLQVPVGTTAPAAIQFTVNLPSSVTAVSVTASSGYLAALTSSTSAPPTVPSSTKEIAYTALTAGSMSFVILGFEGSALAAGPIMSLGVTLGSSATGGQNLTLSNVVAGGISAGNVISVPLTASGATIQLSSPCDINGDGLVTLADVNVVLAQAIASASGNTSACTTGDLTKDGKCLVDDVLREVIAALPPTSAVTGAGICKVGP